MRWMYLLESFMVFGITCGEAPSKEKLLPNLAIGTYTTRGSHGIYLAYANPNSGQIQLLDSIAADNPSFLAYLPKQQALYAAIENGGEKPGQVAGWRRDAETGGYSLLSQRASGGDHPCYVAIDAMGQRMAVANYSGGSFAVYRLLEHGKFGEATTLYPRSGRGPNTGRQEKAHVHTARWEPGTNRLVIADLGTDEVVAYTIHPQTLAVTDSLVLRMPPGAGPRHIEFHPSLPIWYVVHELTGDVSVWSVQQGAQPRMLQTIKTDTISANPGSADIHLSPDGRFCYVSNRSDANNLTVLAVASDGRLETKAQVSVQGKTPRNFLVQQDFVLVANQNTNEVVVFRRNAQTGMPGEVVYTLPISSPVCLVPL